MNRILYYAFGGGLGHVVRTVALARQLNRRRNGLNASESSTNRSANFANSIWEHVVVSNTPFRGVLELVRESEPSMQFKWIPSRLNRAEAGAAIRDLHSETKPKVLVVDTFPRGLGGELVELLETEKHQLRVLISRQLPVEYVASKGLGDFVADNFDLVIGAGEGFGIGPKDVSPSKRSDVKFFCASPFLIRDWNELSNRKVAAEKLNADPDRPIVLFVGCGSQVECEEVAELFEDVANRRSPDQTQLRICLPPSVVIKKSNNAADRISPWPLFECFPAVDLVIGSAGYNLYWETEAVQVSRLLQPRFRKYDNQHSRLGEAIRLDPDLVLEFCQRLTVRTPIVEFENGARESANEIVRKLLQSPFQPA